MLTSSRHQEATMDENTTTLNGSFAQLSINRQPLEQSPPVNPTNSTTSQSTDSVAPLKPTKKPNQEQAGTNPLMTSSSTNASQPGLAPKKPRVRHKKPATSVNPKSLSKSGQVSKKQTVVIRPFAVADSPALAQFRVNKAQFLEDNQDLQRVCCATFVFHNDLLLLVQRSRKDSFPLRWEIPGGSCDFEDESILHAAARELLEETGLHIARINHQVATGDRFETGKKTSLVHWIKFSFDVEVEEEDPSSNHINDCVKLDPKEHEDWLWATEQEVYDGRARGRVLNYVTPLQRQFMLEAFALRKAQKGP